MPAPQFRRYERWTQLLHAAVIGRADITTIAQTGAAHVLLSALALSLDELSANAGYVKLTFDIDTASGPDLDARAAEIVPNTLARLPAQPATALLTFSRQASAGAVLVPLATQVQSAAGVIFQTLADATLPAGQLSLAQVAAQAVVPGSAGLVAAHSLTAFLSKPVGIDNVDNPAAAYGGADQEDDDSFRARIRLYVAGLSRGTAQAFVYGVLGLVDPDTGDTIQHAGVTTYPSRPYYVELYIADAAGTNEGRSTALAAPDTVPEVLTADLLGPPAGAAVGGETSLALNHLAIDSDAARTVTSSKRGALVEGTTYNLDYGAGVVYFTPALVAGEIVTATYSYFTGIVALAQKVVNGDRADWAHFPGLALAGQMVRVRSPQLTLVQVTGSVTTADGYDQGDTLAAATAAATGYLSGLGIGDPVLFSQLTAEVMNVAGVRNVVFTQPLQDVIVAQNQIARPGTVSLQ